MPPRKHTTKSVRPSRTNDDAVAPQAQRSRAEAVAKLRPLTTGDIADIVARYAYSSGGPPESVGDLLELRGVSRACAAAVAHSLDAALHADKGHRNDFFLTRLMGPHGACIALPPATSMLNFADEQLRSGPLVLLAELCRGFATYDAHDRPMLTELHVSPDIGAEPTDPFLDRKNIDGTHAAAATLLAAMMQHPARYFRGVTALSLTQLDPALPAQLLAAVALSPRAACLTSLSLSGTEDAYSRSPDTIGADVAPFIGEFVSLEVLEIRRLRFSLHPTSVAKLKRLTKLRRFALVSVGDGHGCLPPFASCRALSTVLASLPELVDIRLGVPMDAKILDAREVTTALVAPFTGGTTAVLKKFVIENMGYDYYGRDVDPYCSEFVASLMAAHPHLDHVTVGAATTPDLATLVSLQPDWLRQAKALAVAHPRGGLQAGLIRSLAAHAPKLVRLTLDCRTLTCLESDSDSESEDDDEAPSWDASVATAVRDGFPELAELTVRTWHSDVSDDIWDAALEAIAGPRWTQLRVPLTGTPASAAALRRCTGVSQVRNGVEYPA